MPCRKDTLVAAATLGAIVALFLIVFEPFGLNMVAGGAYKLFALVGYGVITFLVVISTGILLPALLPKVYVASRWTLAKDIFISGLPNFILIAICNFFYSIWCFHFQFSWLQLLFSLFATLSVGFLPFVVLLLLRHNRLLKHNLQIAADMNHQLPERTIVPQIILSDITQDVFTLNSDSGYESISFSINDFLYAESADNYIKVTLLDSGTPKTTIIRQTLRGLEELLTGKEMVVRCHRSFVVNLDKVTTFTGNAQGLKLTIEGVEQLIPVSRGSVAAIKQRLNSPE